MQGKVDLGNGLLIPHRARKIAFHLFDCIFEQWVFFLLMILVQSDEDRLG